MSEESTVAGDGDGGWRRSLTQRLSLSMTSLSQVTAAYFPPALATVVSHADAGGPGCDSGEVDSCVSTDGRNGSQSSSGAAANSSQSNGLGEEESHQDVHKRKSASAPLVKVDSLIERCRRPFGLLLMEVPDAQALLSSFTLPGYQASSTSSSGTIQDGSAGGHRLITAIMRDRWVSRLIECCGVLIVRELSRREATLWAAVVEQDIDLKAMLQVSAENFSKILAAASPPSQEEAVEWQKSLLEWAADATEIDFADLLEWFAVERYGDERRWTFRKSLTQISQLFLAPSVPQAKPVMQEEVLSAFRVRCIRAEPLQLAEAVAAYQRSYILTACWRCESRMRGLVQPCLVSNIEGEPVDPLKGCINALLAVLRAMNEELAPAERVVWELMGSRNADFDGMLQRSEVLEAVAEMSAAQLVGRTDASEEALQELSSLRASSQQKSIDELFEANGGSVVTLAHVLKWWWDMPEDYRFAAGLSVPMAMLRKSLRRQPEEMFASQLKRVASSSSLAKAALRGHVQVFAELQALSVRRSIEALEGSPASYTRTTTSEAGSLDNSLDVDDAAEVVEAA